MAYVNAARTVWGAVDDPDDDHRGFLLPIKNNLAPRALRKWGFAYRWEGDAIVWEDEPVHIDIDDILARELAPAQQAKPESDPAVVTIKDWVEMYLPAQGKPGHTDSEKDQILAYDATVWDWKWDGNIAKGERESTAPNPKYTWAAK